MRVLLDENFPLGLLRRLHTDGIEADHIITLGWRGASDARIRERLQDADVLFLTQDEDFLFGMPVASVIVVSRVRQSRPLKERIDVWRTAVLAFGPNAVRRTLVRTHGQWRRGPVAGHHIAEKRFVSDPAPEAGRSGPRTPFASREPLGPL